MMSVLFALSLVGHFWQHLSIAATMTPRLPPFSCLDRRVVPPQSIKATVSCIPMLPYLIPAAAAPYLLLQCATVTAVVFIDAMVPPWKLR